MRTRGSSSWSSRLAQLVERYGGAGALAADVHVYGGGLLAAVALSCWLLPLGFLAFGALLVFIGLRRS